MMPSLAAYSEFIARLSDTFAMVHSATLTLYTIGATLGELEGQLFFEADIVLDVWEVIDFERGVIKNYSYEVYRGSEKLYWYDPWPHPNEPTLAATLPHHKHTPPDIKHHRLPAPELSFTQPNLPYLITEIEREVLHKPMS